MPISTHQKLRIIQKMLALPQAKLAEKLGVSFVAFNNWWTGKSTPHPKRLSAINELFLTVTGQKLIPKEVLTAKKQALRHKSEWHKNMAGKILKTPDIRDQFILKLTYNSNRIEGSTLTEGDTAVILFHNTALSNKSITEHLEAKNHQTALNEVFGHVSKKKKIDEAWILRLHGILMNGILSNAGEYRNHPVRIVGANLPTANHLSVQKKLTELVNSGSKKTKDIIAMAATFHHVFEQIHPFSDGNGRVGRLLLTAMLLRSNLAPAIIRQEKRQRYYTVLHKAQTTPDQSQLEDFLCDAVEDGFYILERKGCEQTS